MTNQKTRGRPRANAPRASVDIVENPRLHRASVAEQEAFIARHEGTMVRSVEKDGDGVITEHERPGTMVMFKPMANGGYSPRTVTVSSLRLLTRQGWYEYCPECHTKHEDANGNPSTDPNRCLAREPVAVRICPVATCRKRIYDNVGSLTLDDADSDDPNVIQDEAFQQSTPAERTRLRVNIHMWTRHPQEATMRGLEPLPMALRELVDQQRPV